MASFYRITPPARGIPSNGLLPGRPSPFSVVSWQGPLPSSVRVHPGPSIHIGRENRSYQAGAGFGWRAKPLALAAAVNVLAVGAIAVAYLSLPTLGGRGDCRWLVRLHRDCSGMEQHPRHGKYHEAGRRDLLARLTQLLPEPRDTPFSVDRRPANLPSPPAAHRGLVALKRH